MAKTIIWSSHEDISIGLIRLDALWWMILRVNIKILHPLCIMLPHAMSFCIFVYIRTWMVYGDSMKMTKWLSTVIAPKWNILFEAARIASHYIDFTAWLLIYGQLIQTILDVPVVVLSLRIQNNKNGTFPFYKLLLCYHTCCTSFHSPQLSLKI